MLKISSRKPASKCPYRSPEAVSVAISDLLNGKVVCEIGCAEGDNMTFMSRFCKRTFGFDINPNRFKVAEVRGLNVRFGDYRSEPIPEADVYYFWPDTCDCPFLIDKIIGQGKPCTIIAAGDDGYPPEVPCILECHRKFGGEIRQVPFHEGNGHRENGVIYLLIIRQKLLL